MPVIVQFASSAAAEEGLTFARRAGCRGGRRLRSIRGVAILANLESIAALSQQAAVVRVSADLPVTVSATAPDAAVGGEAAYQAAGLTGQGVGVAVLDTGVFPHWDLGPRWASRIVAWRDFVNDMPDPYDDNGHGTHVAGIVGGDGHYSFYSGGPAVFRGVAPGANLIGAKVLDRDGIGRTSDVIAAIDWCIEIAPSYNLRVINLSLGRRPVESYRTDPL